jgi:translocation and assembly module TamB
MASDASHTRQAPKRPRARKALLLLLVLPALLAIAAAWLLVSESGARAAFAALDAASGGALQAQGIHGRLTGPLRLEHLRLEQPNDRLDLSELRLDWRPSALLRAKLHVNSLRIGYLGITSRMDKPPQAPTLPVRIALPFALQADDVQVDGGEINRGPVNLLRLGSFAFNLDFDGARYQLRLHRFAAASALESGSVATSFSGQATLSTIKPYALQAGFSSDSNARIEGHAIGASGRITLDGSLAELTAGLDLAVNHAPVKGNAVLRPFSEQQLGAAQLSAQQLDLAGLDKKLPHTALDIRLSAAENGTGTLRIANPAAGTYDEQRLPISALNLSFSQIAGQFHIDSIAAMLGSVRMPAGSLAGAGRIGDGALMLALRTDALDAQRIDRRMRGTRLSGRIDLRHLAGKQEFTIALSEPLHKERITLDAHGVMADAALTIDRAQLQAGIGRIDASGHLSFAGRQDFSAQGKIIDIRLRELVAFVQAPALELNGEFSLRGMRQPQLESDLSFTISNSRLAGQPLSGDGQAQLRADRLLVPKFLLQAGANRLTIQGKLSQGDAQLAFALNAPQLAQIGLGLGGSVQAGGVVRGSLMQARVDVHWTADKVRAPGALQIDAMQGKADISIDRKRPFMLDAALADISGRGLRYGADELRTLTAQLRFAPQPNAPLALSIRAEGLSLGQLRAERFNASANGTTAQHTVEVSLHEAGQAWAIKASGALSRIASAARWQGNVQAFDASGRVNARLASPASLLLSSQRMQLDSFVLDADSGRIAVEHFARDAGGIVTRGRIERVRFAELLRHVRPAPALKSDLQLGGEWDIRIADALAGSIKLRREGGDVTMLGDAPVTLGLRTLNAEATAAGGRLALQFQADGRQLGRIELSAATRIGSGASRVAIAPDAAISGSAHIDLPSLGAIAPLLSPSLAADGRLQAEVSAAGTFGQPRFAGRIEGSGLRLALADLGLDLRQGSLQSEFQDNRLLVRHLDFQGSEGRVSLSGPIELNGGTVAAQLALHAQRFALLNRADRRMIVSGDSQIVLREQHATVSGAFVVDAGFFDLGYADKPQLSSDVVIVGRSQKQPARIATDVDIFIALGDGVVLKGRGLNAQMAGEIHLVSAAGETLRAQGTLNVAKGTYTAYSRELAIEQGLLRFGGPINNPALDILAMRRGQEVETGVSVRGTALAPRIALVSEPPLPDAEKLSWLVLGHGLATAGETDAGALQSAAGALLSESAAAGAQSIIAGALGLDTFSVGTSQDNLQNRIVTMGKQISSRLYLGYQQGLESTASVVQLRYVLSPRLSLEAEAGTRSAISVFYNLAFD